MTQFTAPGQAQRRAEFMARRRGTRPTIDPEQAGRLRLASRYLTATGGAGVGTGVGTPSAPAAGAGAGGPAGNARLALAARYLGTEPAQAPAPAGHDDMLTESIAALAQHGFDADGAADAVERSGKLAAVDPAKFDRAVSGEVAVLRGEGKIEQADALQKYRSAVQGKLARARDPQFQARLAAGKTREVAPGIFRNADGEALTASDALGEIGARPSQLVPFVGSASDIASAAAIYRAAKAVEAGEATPEQERALAEFAARERQKSEQGSTLGYKVVSILSQLPAFAGELALTAGIYSTGRVAGTKGAEFLIEKAVGTVLTKSAAARAAGRVAVAGAGAVTGAALQTVPAAGLRVAADTITNMTPGVQPQQLPSGTVRGVLSGDKGDGFVAALTRAFGHNFVEIVSERAGGALGHIPGAARVSALKRAVMERWLRLRPGSTVNDFAARVAERTGWNGVVGEVFEERVAEALHALDPEQDYSPPTLEQLAAEAAAFAVPGAAGAAIRGAAGTRKERTDGARDQTAEGADEGRDAVPAGTRTAAETGGEPDPTIEEIDTEVGQALSEQAKAARRAKRDAAFQRAETNRLANEAADSIEQQAQDEIDNEMSPEEWHRRGMAMGRAGLDIDRLPTDGKRATSFQTGYYRGFDEHTGVVETDEQRRARQERRNAQAIPAIREREAPPASAADVIRAAGGAEGVRGLPERPLSEGGQVVADRLVVAPTSELDRPSAENGSAEEAGAGGERVVPFQSAQDGGSDAELAGDALNGDGHADQDTAREPWEMTHAQFVERARREAESRGAAFDAKKNAKFLKQKHRENVERAISFGKPVPAAVLEDFPEFKPSAAAQDALERQRAGKPAAGQRSAEPPYIPEGVKPNEPTADQMPLSPEPGESPERNRVRSGIVASFPKVPAEHVDAAMAVLDARAATWGKAKGKPAEEWFRTRIAGVEDAGQHAREPASRASTTFLQDGRAVIRAFNKTTGKPPTLHSLLHEVGHVFRRDLEGDDRAVVEQWAGVSGGKWGTEHEEKFATAAERYFMEGRSPTAALRPVFDRFKEWMAAILRMFSGSLERFSPGSRAAFDRLLGATPGARPGGDVSNTAPAPGPATATTPTPAPGQAESRGADANALAQPAGARGGRPRATRTAADERAASKPSAAARSEREDSKAEKTEHEFSTTQFDVHDAVYRLVRNLQSRIPRSSLAGDGIEKNPHITVKYGLHGDDPGPLRELLKNEPPITARLAGVSTFPPSESGGAEVLKIDIESEPLRRLNGTISGALEHTDTHPEYRPHITLAYVKKGEGAAIAKKLGDVPALEFTLNTITFSDRGGTRTEFRLDGTDPAASARFRPFDPARASLRKHHSWKGSVLEGDGPLVSDGRILLRRSAVKKAADLAKISGVEPVNHRSVPMADAQSLWDSAVAGATKDAETIGTLTDADEPEFGAVLFRAGETQVFAPERGVALIQKLTGFDAVRVGAPNTPILFLKNGEPVAVAAPHYTADQPAIDADAARRAVAEYEPPDELHQLDIPPSPDVPAGLFDETPTGLRALGEKLSGAARELKNSDRRVVADLGHTLWEFGRRTWNAAANAGELIRLGLQRGSTAIAGLNVPGRTLAEQIRVVSGLASARGNTDALDIRRAIGGLTRAERVLVAKTMNGRVAASSVPPKIRDAAATLTEILDRSMNEASALGVTRRINGEDVPLRGGARAYPQVLNDAGRRFLEEAHRRGLSSPVVKAFADRMVKEGKFATAGAAVKALFDMREARLRGVNAYLERTRVELDDEMIEWDLGQTLAPLVHRNALLVEGVRAWGVDLQRAYALIGAITDERGPAVGNAVREFVQSHFDAQPPALGRSLFGFLSNYQTIVRLGLSPFSVLQNIGQRISGTVLYEPQVLARALRAYPPFINRFFESSRRLHEAVERSGATGNISELANVEAQSPGFRVAQRAMAMFSSAEEGNQTTAAIMARYGLERDLRRLMTQDAFWKTRAGKVLESLASLTMFRDPADAVQRRVERSIDPKRLREILAGGPGVTQAEIEHAMRSFVNDTQFALNLATERLWWRTSPFLRVMFKFKTWGVDQIGLIYRDVLREAARGNFGPIARFGVAMIVTGELYHLIRDFFTGSDTAALGLLWSDGENPKGLAERLMGDFVRGGGVGLLADLTYGITGFALGPMWSTAENLLGFTADVVQRPGQVGTAAREFARQEISAARQAEQVYDRIESAVSADAAPAAGFTRLRARARDWKKDHDAPTLGDKVQRTLAGVFEGGRTGFSRTDRTLSLSYAARQIDAGDVGDAEEYLFRILKDTAPGPERMKVLQGIRASARLRAPLGPVPQKDRAAFFASLGGAGPGAGAGADEARRLQARWTSDYEQAIRRAIARLHGREPARGARRAAPGELAPRGGYRDLLQSP